MKKIIVIVSAIMLVSTAFAQTSKNVYNVELDFSSCLIGNVPEKYYATYDPYWTTDKERMPTYLAYGCNEFAKNEATDIILAIDPSLPQTLRISILKIDGRDGNTYAKMSIIDNQTNSIVDFPEELKGDGDDGLRDECNIHKPSFPNRFSEAMFKAMCDIGDAVRAILYKRAKK